MHTNKLYYFLTQKPHLIPHLFIKNTDKKQHDYLYHNLPKPRIPTLISLSLSLEEKRSLTLSEHHISVYEYMDKSHQFLSEYHYTAYFLDEENNKYQLHVYFNNKDQLTADPRLTQVIDNKKETLVLDDEDKKSFHYLAVEYTQFIIKEIRASFDKQIKQDNEELLRLDVQTSHPTQDPSHYSAAIEQYLAFLQQIIPYHENSEYHASVFKILTHIKINLQKSLNKKYKTPQHVKESTDELEDHCSSFDLEIMESKKEIIKPLFPLISEALNAYSLYKKDAPSWLQKIDKIPFLNRSIELAQEAELLIDDQGFETTASDLTLLKDLIKNTHQERVKLLEYLLLNNQFTAAKLLIGTNKESNTDCKIFLIALKLGAFQLVQFLLEHYHLSINTLLIPSTQGELSPLMYCFLNSKNKNHIACFELLVKHGASLMECTPEGLPIAHLILSDISHPLFKVFQANSQTTINSISFYKNLIRVLSVQTEVDFSSTIQNYQGLIEHLQNIKIEGSSLIKLKLEEKAAISLSNYIASSFYKKCALLLCNSDKEIHSKSMELNFYLTHFIAQNPKEIQSLIGIGTKALNDLTQLDSEVIDKLFVNQHGEHIDFPTLKKSMLKYLDEMIKNCKMFTESKLLANKPNKKDAKAFNQLMETMQTNHRNKLTKRSAQIKELKQARKQERLFDDLLSTIDKLKEKTEMLKQLLDGSQKACKELHDLSNDLSNDLDKEPQTLSDNPQAFVNKIGKLTTTLARIELIEDVEEESQVRLLDH